LAHPRLVGSQARYFSVEENTGGLLINSVFDPSFGLVLSKPIPSGLIKIAEGDPPKE
jgi:hypothetical protein